MENQHRLGSRTVLLICVSVVLVHIFGELALRYFLTASGGVVILAYAMSYLLKMTLLFFALATVFVRFGIGGGHHLSWPKALCISFLSAMIVVILAFLLPNILSLMLSLTFVASLFGNAVDLLTVPIGLVINLRLGYSLGQQTKSILRTRAFIVAIVSALLAAILISVLGLIDSYLYVASTSSTTLLFVTLFSYNSLLQPIMDLLWIISAIASSLLIYRELTRVSRKSGTPIL